MNYYILIGFSISLIIDLFCFIFAKRKAKSCSYDCSTCKCDKLDCMYKYCEEKRSNNDK